jgi:hypothetical protein
MTFTEPPDWHQHAACAGTDPDLFFPGRGQPITTEPVAEVAELAFMNIENSRLMLELAALRGDADVHAFHVQSGSTFASADSPKTT